MTPQDKKRLSYLKDRRNTYGENSKSSRRSIARNKRVRSRSERRIAREAFADGGGEPEAERIDAIRARTLKKRRTAWTKWPDEPLGEVVERELARRARTGIMRAEDAEARVQRIRKLTRR
jgi:hypothetical protein